MTRKFDAAARVFDAMFAIVLSAVVVITLIWALGRNYALW